VEVAEVLVLLVLLVLLATAFPMEELVEQD
jgi:hypothetical protein